MGCHFRLQGILLSQGSNPRFHWQVDSLPMSHPRRWYYLRMRTAVFKIDGNSDVVENTGTQCSVMEPLRRERT